MKPYVKFGIVKRTQNDKPKEKKMPILRITDPQWNKDNRCWIFNYVIQDKNMGEYVQVVRTEALISAMNYIKLLKEKIR